MTLDNGKATLDAEAVSRFRERVASCRSGLIAAYLALLIFPTLAAWLFRSDVALILAAAPSFIGILLLELTLRTTSCPRCGDLAFLGLTSTLFRTTCAYCGLSFLPD